MISAIQPAGMVLIVEITSMLITGICFVNGQYSGLRVLRFRILPAGFWAGLGLRPPASPERLAMAGMDFRLQKRRLVK
jgi:hypothetical protein